MRNATQPARRLGRRAFTASSLAALAAARPVLGANDRMGIGVIGCGGRGTAHMHTLLALKSQGEPIDIVGLCDTYRPRLAGAAKLTGAAFTTMEHEQLVARPDVDVVLVATPDHWHGFHTIDAMRAGKDVYCEKPLTHWRQLGLPERMLRVAEETKSIVQVGCQRMSSTAYAQARALVRQGAIGKLLMAETGYYRIGDWGERGMPIDDPNAAPGANLDWERFQGDAPKRDFDVSRYFRWRMYWDYSGGPGTDNYVHFYTPLAYMLDLAYPDNVVATGGKYRYEEREVPDTFNMLADYPGKLTVLCHGTQGNDFQAPGSGEQPLIRGWDGTLSIEGAEIVVRPTSGSTAQALAVPITAGTDEQRFWRSFLVCCRTRAQPESGIALNAAVATTLQMATLAMRERRYVRYDREKKAVL
jgi:predicted dehydrogenase